MQSYSISQVAKIFKIMKYTIRHYINEHLLEPLKDEVNGYYVFSEVDLYRLYQVITFRKIGYSISSIKELLVQNDLVNVFEIAENKIQNKIDELVKIKSSIQEIIQQLSYLIYHGFRTKYTATLFSEETAKNVSLFLAQVLSSENSKNLIIAHQDDSLCGCLFFTNTDNRLIYDVIKQKYSGFMKFKVLLFLRYLNISLLISRPTLSF